MTIVSSPQPPPDPEGGPERDRDLGTRTEAETAAHGATATTTGGDGDARSPVAAIWLSGLQTPGIVHGLEDVAKRIAFAHSRRDTDPATTFAVRSAIKPERVGDALDLTRCTVLRTNASGTEPILDLYGLDTTRTLIGDRAERSLLTQLALASRSVIGIAAKALRTRDKTHGKTPRERLQLLYGWGWMIVSILGLLVLVGLLLGTVAVSNLPPELKALQGAIVAIGGLSIWKSAFARRLGATALIGYSVVDYLDRADDAGGQLRGQLEELLKYLARLEHRYCGIDVVAYSFGSIVAIDALYPYAQAPPPRLASVDRLITIACPFDFVRSYWNEYFTNRFSLAQPLSEWVNFYAPSDVLASNFRNDSDPESADNVLAVRGGQQPPPRPQNVRYFADGREQPVSRWEAFRLKGLRVHVQYWSQRVASEESVFDHVVEYLGQPASQGSPE